MNETWRQIRLRKEEKTPNSLINILFLFSIFNGFITTNRTKKNENKSNLFMLRHSYIVETALQPTMREKKEAYYIYILP